MEHNSSYAILIKKLDTFIRKYYLNQLIRGSLYSIGLILGLFLLFSVAEYNFYFPKGVRAVMFFSFVGVSLFALILWVIRPLTNYFQLGNLISHERAAIIIGDHFGNVKDKLLNILQLRKQAEEQDDNDLLFASIDQKSEEIQPVPFRNAINLNNNKKYVKYALPPLLLLLVLLFAAPSWLTDGSRRVMSLGQDFTKPAPFYFKINKNNLSVVQYQDYPLAVKIEGESLPNEVFIEMDNYQYRMQKIAADSFAFVFNNVQKDIDFELTAGGVRSPSYKLDVMLKPSITDFEVKLDYPAYTGRIDEQVYSIGDVTVPVGTNLSWLFNAVHTDQVEMLFSSNEVEKIQTSRDSKDAYSYKKRAMGDEYYKVFISNRALPGGDSITYSISVIPDLHPEIKLEVFPDSTDNKLFYFLGEASDDYGLSYLTFNYQITHEDGKEEGIVSTPINITQATKTVYDHVFDLNELDLKPGDEVSYYFEIFDNDGVHGSKSSRTNMMQFKKPTVEEFEEKADANEEKIKDNLKKSLEDVKKLQDDMKKMQEKLLQKDELDWKDKKELDKLVKRQEELQKQVEEAKKAFEENIQNQEEFSKQDEQIMEKQEQLQELFEEVMTEEMQEMMEKLQEMLQKLEKEDALEMAEEMEMNDEEVEMELDRLMELYKNLEVEQEMQEAIDKLEEMAEKQEELAEKTENMEEPNEDLQKEQEELNKEMEKLEEKMKDLEKKNEELENPKDMEDTEEEMDDIQEDMKDSMDKMEKMDNSGASKKQKSAAEKMKKMAGAMSMKMQSGEMEQMEEDMKALRQLLENLVTMSFEQEALIDAFADTRINTPKYVTLVQDQFKLEDDFGLIQDSLQALSKRVYQIESFVTEKVTEINNNLEESTTQLEARKVADAADHQQRTMKNVNDLALMLSETMSQMQAQMSGDMPGNQNCSKPGGTGKGGAKPSDKMSEGQESLNKQMKQALKKMKNGRGSAKEFAQMAAKQAALRKALEGKAKKKSQQGKGDKQLSDLIEQMNKVETDLVNKKLTNEMMKRQQDILTRLLKHEKAERQRELDNKRKAETAQQIKREMPPALKEYIKQRQAEVESYKTISPALKPYYKNLVENYFKGMN